METAYKKKNPNELAYYISVASDCPIGEAQGESILEGVFVRSRIKPLGGTLNWLVQPLYLSVSVDCLKLTNQNPVYTLGVKFGNASEEVPVFYMMDYGGFGIGTKRSLRSLLRDNIESAVTDYLKVNFDLAD